jgi:hypothetical protein
MKFLSSKGRKFRDLSSVYELKLPEEVLVITALAVLPRELDPYISDLHARQKVTFTEVKQVVRSIFGSLKSRGKQGIERSKAHFSNNMSGGDVD